MSQAIIQPLFPVYQSAADYLSKTGKPALWDPTLGFVKYWADPAAASASQTASTTYSFIVEGPDIPYIQTRPVLNSIAGFVNIPPAPAPSTYPAYVVPASNSTDAAGGPVNPDNFSSLADANSLVSSLSAAGVLTNGSVVDQPEGGVIYGSDGRRMYVVTGTSSNGQAISVTAELLIIAMNANGVGAPGNWVASGAQFQWVSNIAPTVPVTLPAYDVPVVPLLPGQYLTNGEPMSGAMGAVVVTPDPAPAPTPTPATGVVDLSPVTSAIASLSTTVTAQGAQLTAMQTQLSEISGVLQELLAK